MIKYLGSVGTFIRLNDNENKTYQLLNIFSSSAANYSLFSAEVNNSTGAITFNSASTSIYVNGVPASVLPSQEWAHMTLSFEDKLATYEVNNFLIRWGDTASSNFNIQNLYILESSFTSQEVAYLHQEFTGGGNNILSVSDSASFSINIVDAPEDSFTSSSTNFIYQPLKNQKNFLSNISAATDNSLSLFVSASTMYDDNLYVDGYQLSSGERVLSLADNQLYELNASAYLVTVSSSPGDFVKIVSGRTYANHFYQNDSGVFTNTQARNKINYYLNTFD